MKYAFRTQIYAEPLEKSLERLQRYGYDGVELLGEPDKYESAELRDLLNHYGLELPHVNADFAPQTGRDLCHPDEGVRRATVEYCKRCLEWARDLGADSVEVRPSPEGKSAPTAPLAQERRWAIEALEELASFGAALGVAVAIEPANRYEVYMVNSVDDALRMIEEVGSDNLGILADCFHMNIEDVDIAQALRKAGSRLLNVHIADSNRQPVGRGHTDFQTVMRTLKEMGYSGYLTMEPVPLWGRVPPDDTLDAYYAESIELMRLHEAMA